MGVLQKIISMVDPNKCDGKQRSSSTQSSYKHQ